MQERPDLSSLGLDLSCKYAAHVRRDFPSLSAELSCYIGWMHPHSGHGLSCQLKFSAMFATGLGRTALENMEQLFVSFLLQPMSSHLHNCSSSLSSSTGSYFLKDRVIIPLCKFDPKRCLNPTETFALEYTSGASGRV